MRRLKRDLGLVDISKMKTGIFIPAGRKPWLHEMRVAEILALAGHRVEFIEEKSGIRTADIRLDGIEFEIKSPETFNANSLQHKLRDASKQSPNIIIDTSRIRKIHDQKIMVFLIHQVRKQKQIKCLLMITKRGQIIDISALI